MGVANPRALVGIIAFPTLRVSAVSSITGESKINSAMTRTVPKTPMNTPSCVLIGERVKYAVGEINAKGINAPGPGTTRSR